MIPETSYEKPKNPYYLPKRDREIIKDIIDRRINAFTNRLNQMRSPAGQKILMAMQYKYKEKWENKGFLNELKSINKKIGADAENALRFFSSFGSTADQFKLLLTDLPKQLIKEGIPEDLAVKLEKQVYKYLVQSPPEKLPFVIEESIHHLQIMLRCFENGENITADLQRDQDRIYKILPQTIKFRKKLENYKPTIDADAIKSILIRISLQNIDSSA